MQSPTKNQILSFFCQVLTADQLNGENVMAVLETDT